MNECFLSKREVTKITGRSATSLWRDTNAGIFPAPRKTGPGRVGWLASEITAWMSSRPVALTVKEESK